MNFQKPDAQLRWWDVPAALLLVVALYLSALRLSATKWTEELSIIIIITMIGVALGLALGQSKFNWRTATWYGLIIGVSTIGWQLGLTLGKGILWSERALSIGGRLGTSIQNLISDNSVSDPILFLFIMATLYWVLSVFAGYTLTREANPWKATLPMGLAMFIIHIHDPFWTTRSWFLAGFIFLALLLLSRVTFLRKQQTWVSTQTHMPPYVGLDFLRATLIAGAVMILFAWTAPALAAPGSTTQELWQKISRPIQEARADMSNAFASLRSSVGVVNEYYGASIPLGRGNVLNDSVILSIQAPIRPDESVRYYWRARVFDTYEEGSWDANFDAIQFVEPGASSFILPNNEGRWEASFTFTPAVPMITLYTAPQPIMVSRPVKAEVFNNPDNTVDITSIQSQKNLQPGEQYEVVSSLTNVTEAELRASGSDYPDWVIDRYLQVPDSITDRTKDLAKELASGQETPYDIATAVTEWLRENIQYSDTIPTPPSNQDPIDWMLFDLKQGFCNYYATSEVMMLRSLGIPARWAVGYAQGSLDIESNIYTVRQRDAHSWPEVYFPNIGWVEFEPTLNQRPIRRPLGDPLLGNGSANDPNGDSAISDLDREALLGFESLEDQDLLDEENLTALGSDAARSSPRNILIVIVPGILIIGIASFAFLRRQKFAEGKSQNGKPVEDPIAVKIEARMRKIGIRPPGFIRRWAYQASLPPQARAYQEINRALKRLGFPPEAHFTPSERASNLRKILPSAAEITNVLLEEYQSLTYRSLPGDPALAQDAAKKVRKASWAALFQRYFSRFQEPKQREPIV